MTNSETIFKAIGQDKADDLRAFLDGDLMLVHSRLKSENGEILTTLQVAAALGKIEICRLLVDLGAEVYTNPMSTYPPIMHAAWGKHREVVDYFLNDIPEKAAGTNGLGVTINLAGRQGWIEIVKRHIAADPLSIHQRGWIGDSPVHWPSHNDFTDVVEILLDAGAEIEADETNWIGGKPLHWASERAVKTVELLLSRGADVNSRDICKGSKFEGATPLIWNATQRDDCAEVTKLLLDAGADINAVDAAGKSALDHAREKGLPRIVSVLTSKI
jgi:ankyrin repeat protein